MEQSRQKRMVEDMKRSLSSCLLYFDKSEEEFKHNKVEEICIKGSRASLNEFMEVKE